MDKKKSDWERIKEFDNKFLGGSKFWIVPAGLGAIGGLLLWLVPNVEPDNPNLSPKINAFDRCVKRLKKGGLSTDTCWDILER